MPGHERGIFFAQRLLADLRLEGGCCGAGGIVDNALGIELISLEMCFMRKTECQGTEDPSSCWVAPQKLSAARVGPSQSQEPGAVSGVLPRGWQGPQYLGYPPLLFQV